MTGRGFHCTTEAIPRRPWKAKTSFASGPVKISIKKGTRGVHTRYDTVLLPFISIVRCPSRPVMPLPEKSESQNKKLKKTLRAKGTLIREPLFSTPCEMRFFPREKGAMAFVEGFSLKRPFSLSREGKSHLAGGRKLGLAN